MLLQAGSYTNYFADALIAEAELDSRVVGIHAAMGGGTGMNRFEQRFPERTFDVGIAEQVCCWLPCPCALYSCTPIQACPASVVNEGCQVSSAFTAALVDEHQGCSSNVLQKQVDTVGQGYQAYRTPVLGTWHKL